VKWYYFLFDWEQEVLIKRELSQLERFLQVLKEVLIDGIFVLDEAGQQDLCASGEVYLVNLVLVGKLALAFDPL